MGMYGDRDVIVNPDQWKALQTGIPHARIERFSQAGHFIMLDEQQRFKQCLRDFLDYESLSVFPFQEQLVGSRTNNVENNLTGSSYYPSLQRTSP